ncbi:MAG: hypothetical protein AAB477_01520 [Patescibacteria group bacterium]
MCNTKFIIQSFFIFWIALATPLSILAFDIVLPPENVSVSAVVGSTAIGGGGGDYSFRTTVSFSGFAYPGAIVHIWRNGLPVTTTIADVGGVFTADLYEQYSTNSIYTLYAIDEESRRSLLLNYPIVVTNGYYTSVSGVRFPPTISTDRVEVKFSDSITISGYALPDKEVEVLIYGQQSETFLGTTESNGTYKFIYSLAGFQRGDYNVRINYKNDKRNSKVVKFTISNINIPSTESVNNIPGDCNADQIINIVDFSVLAFWYGKDNPPRCVDTNNDNIINLVDFSILAFYWTG